MYLSCQLEVPAMQKAEVAHNQKRELLFVDCVSVDKYTVVICAIHMHFASVHLSFILVSLVRSTGVIYFK
jgi:hypothetical protein